MAAGNCLMVILRWLFGTPLGRYALGALAIVAAVGGFYLWAEGRGEQKIKTQDAGAVTKETDHVTKDRAGVDAGERARTDDAATKCLRNPTGC